MKVRWKQALSLLLAAPVILSLCGTYAMAQADPPQNKTEILSFSELPREIREQSVTIGVSLGGLVLPETLRATVRPALPPQAEGNAKQQETDISVTWNSTPEYKPDQIGAYRFTPVLPDAYILADGVGIPRITVGVGITIGASGMLGRAAGLTVTGGTAGSDYTYAGNVLTILSGSPMIISGSTAADRIKVQSANANLTFDNLYMDLSNVTALGGTYRPFDMEGASVNLYLSGTSTLHAPSGAAAIYCPEGASLIIDGSGTLNADVGNRGGASAIGGEQYNACGSITINGGTVNAACNIEIVEGPANSGAAIGGYKGGPITINGGTVSASGGKNTAAIGSFGSSFNGIFINGGTIRAEISGGTSMSDIASSDCLGPAIGVAGGTGSSFQIIIRDGDVTAVSKNDGCAAIGGARNGSSGYIEITGGTVNATGPYYGAAGIGGGLAQNGGGNGSEIVITGNADVTARGGVNAPGIGSGAPRQDNVKNQANSGTITISGGANVNAYGGKNAYGIGSGGSETSGITLPECCVVDKVVITGSANINSTTVAPGNIPAGNPSQSERFNEYICTVPGLNPIPSGITPQNSLTVDVSGRYVVSGSVSLTPEVIIPENTVIQIPAGSVLYVPAGASLPSSVTASGGGSIVRGDPPPPANKAKLTVIGGTGGGYYNKGATVNKTISAVVPEGKAFVKWEKTSGNATIQSPSSPVTDVIVYGADVTITAIFKDAPASITGVTVSPVTVTVQKGTKQSFTALVNGTGAYDKTVTWSVSGGVSGTSVDAGGTLTVSANETAASLTVLAVANGDNSKSASALVTVTSAPVIKHSLVVRNGTGSGQYAQGDAIPISAAVPDGMTFVRWELTSGGGAIADPNAESTVFTMGAGDAAVTAVLDGGQSPGGGAVTSVSVSPMAVQVSKGGVQQFIAEVTGTGAYSKEVEWTVSGGAASTRVDANGLLTVGTDETAATLAVTATSKMDGGKFGFATVTVVDKPAEQYSITVGNGSGSGVYPEGTVVRVIADIPAGKKFVRWTLSGPGSIKSLISPDTSFTVGKGDAVITAVFAAADDSSSSSSTPESPPAAPSSSSSKASSSQSPDKTNTPSAEIRDKPSSNVDARKSVKTADALKAVKNNPKEDVTVRNAVSVSVYTLQQMASVTRDKKGDARLAAETTLNGKVMGKLYLDPIKAEGLSGEIRLGVRTDEKSTGTIRRHFEKFFTNKLGFVHLDHTGPYGMPVEVAAALVLPVQDLGRLYLYSYDKATNAYTPIKDPQCRIDEQGMLRFTTPLGGDIVVSDDPLARR